MAVSEQVVPQRPWSPVLAPLAFAAGFGGAILGGIVVAVVGTIAGASLSHPPPVVGLLSTVLQDLAFVLSALFFAARVARPRAGDFGLTPTPLVRALGFLAVAYLSFVGFSAAWIAALNIKDKEKVVDQLGANNGTVALVAVCLLTCVIAPVCEEFFFRGFFFTALRSWRGPWLAAVITGLVFGAVHFGSAPVGYLVPLAFFGFVLCILYWKTRSLYPCIAAHALNNSIALGITEHWGWQIPVLAVASLAAIGLLLTYVARVSPAH